VYLDRLRYNAEVYDWNGLGARYFRMLSTICQLANETIDDAVRRFGVQSFITSNVLSEDDFNAQMNTTVNKLTESLVIQFGLLVNTVRLFTQVDQPYTNFNNAELVGVPTTNETNSGQPIQVRLLFSYSICTRLRFIRLHFS
jgi:hypothetical protein